MASLMVNEFTVFGEMHRLNTRLSIEFSAGPKAELSANDAAVKTHPRLDAHQNHRGSMEPRQHCAGHDFDAPVQNPNGPNQYQQGRGSFLAPDYWGVLCHLATGFAAGATTDETKWTADAQREAA